MFQMRHGAGSIRASWSLEMSKDAAYGVLSVRVFFFSSRRRHTRFDCDWSSDVCSSDLYCCPTASQLEIDADGHTVSHKLFMISGQNESGDQTGTVEEIEFTDARPRWK